VAQLLILSFGGTEVLPALSLLSHKVRHVTAEPSQLITAPDSDLIVIDARRNLANAKGLCKILHTTNATVPLMLVLTEGGLAAVNMDWNVDDVILDDAGPAEVDARIRLAIGRKTHEQYMAVH
jgi:DNA-binding response OmpR family regulator